jgi:hypothetical protein
MNPVEPPQVPPPLGSTDPEGGVVPVPVPGEPLLVQVPKADWQPMPQYSVEAPLVKVSIEGREKD